MPPADNSLDQGYGTVQGPNDSNLTAPGQAVSDPVELQMASSRRASLSPFRNRKVTLLTTATVTGVMVLTAAAALLFGGHSNQNLDSSKAGGNFAVGSLSLDEVKQAGQLNLADASKLAVNGQLSINGTVVLTPSAAPSTPVAGQIYYDKSSNAPYYYNGKQFVSLTPAPPGVTSLQGLTGALSLHAGSGIAINGTTISSTVTVPAVNSNGLTSITSSDNSLVVTPGAGGSVDLTVAAGPGVTSVGGVNGAISLGSGLAMSGNSLENTGLLNINGTPNQIFANIVAGTATLSLPQDIAVTSSPTFGGLTLNGGLSVTAGGVAVTGGLTAAGGANLSGSVVIDGLTLPGSDGTVGQCVDTDGAGNLGFTSCLTNAVLSLNGLSGALTLANASAAGSTVTIDDAGTAQKGIAQFNGADFGVSAGTVSLNTVGVGKGGTGLTLTPTNGQLLIGNGSGYTLSTLSNSDGTVMITNGPGSIDISVPRADQCSTCADFTLSNLSDIVAINKSLLPATAGSIDLGGSAVPYRYLYLSGDSLTPSSNGFKISGVATSARTINFPDASGNICLDTNNCGFVTLQTGSPSAQTGSLDVTGSVIAGTNLQAAGLSVTANATIGGALTVNSIGSASGAGLAIAASSGNALTLGSDSAASQPTLVQGTNVTFATNGIGSNAINYSFSGPTAGLEAAGGSYQICDTSGNCAGTGGGVTITSSGMTNQLAKFSGSQSLTNSIFSDDGTNGTVGGSLTVQGSSLAGSGALILSSAGAGNALSLSSGSGTLVLGGTTGTIQRSASSLTLDVNSTADSTLTITNSNATHVANLSVEGGVNIGSGQAYKINNASINTGGTLSNVAYLDQANSFSNVGTNSFAGNLSVTGSINSQTIGSAAVFSGTLAVKGANALSLGQAATNSGAIIFANNVGSNIVTLKGADVDPASSFTLTLPSALGSSGDCLEQTNGTGALGFVSCASGLGGSGSTGNIPMFSGPTTLANSLLSQSGTVVSIQGAGNDLSVGDTISVGTNGVSGIVGQLALKDGQNPGFATTVASQVLGASYTLELPTDSTSTGVCLVLQADGAGKKKITTGSCAAGGSGGNINASGAASAVNHLQVVNSYDGVANYTSGISLIQDNGSGVGVNVAPQTGFVLSVGSSDLFNVTDGGQLEIGNPAGSPLTFATSGAINNATTIGASGQISTSKSSGNALLLSGTAPINNASLFQMGPNAIASGSANGTYIGANPTTFSGNFVDYQVGGASKFKVDSSGNVTAGTINGVTIGGSGALTTGGGFTLTLTGNSTLNQDLTTTSNVQFGSLTLGTALAASQGGTGTDNSGALAGAALIFNATTGTFQANRLSSSDNSLTINNSDGNIDLTVASCSACAKTDLSNLTATTNINSTLQAQAGVDLGSVSNPFRNLYLYGSAATPGSKHFSITGSPSAVRTITLPDNSGTVCLDVSVNNCSFVSLQTSGPSPQTGSLDVSGNVIAGATVQGVNLSISGTGSVSGTFTVSSITAAAATNLSITPASGQNISIGANGASQTTTIQGSSVSFKSNDGAASAITYSFQGPLAGHEASGGSYTICDSTGNCAGAGGGVITSGGTNGDLAKFSSGNTIVNSILSDDGSTASVAGNFSVSATAVGGNAIVISDSAINTNNATLGQLSFTNAATAGNIEINGLAVSPTGTATTGTNTLNGIKFNNVAAASNNSYYALTVGTGYTAALRVGSTAIIDGSGILQNAALSGSIVYSNLAQVSNLTATGGTITVGTASQTGSLVLDSSSGGNITLSLGAVGSGASYSVSLPTAIGSAGQCLSISSVASTTETLGYGTCGTSTHSKKIILTAEYAGATLDAASDTGGTVNCNTNNSGTMTSGWDNTQKTTYYQWTSTQSSEQCYDIMVQIPVPSDWSAWASTTPISVQMNASSTSNTHYAFQVLNTSGTAETSTTYGTQGTFGATGWAAISPVTLSSTTTGYSAGGVMTLKIRVQAKSSATVQVGTITLNYTSAY